MCSYSYISELWAPLGHKLLRKLRFIYNYTTLIYVNSMFLLIIQIRSSDESQAINFLTEVSGIGLVENYSTFEGDKIHNELAKTHQVIFRDC